MKKDDEVLKQTMSYLSELSHDPTTCRRLFAYAGRLILTDPEMSCAISAAVCFASFLREGYQIVIVEPKGK